MALQFVLGKDSTELNEYILDSIKAELVEDKEGLPIFYIVPEQMTFQQEYDLFQDEAIKGSIRAQVVSFSRLAWRVLQEVGGSTKQFISATGTQMMLRKIIEQRTEPFEAFEKASDKIGFLEEVDQVITEFKRHEVSPEVLETYITYTDANPALHHKLTDLLYLYSKLEEAMEGHYIDGEDQLQLLLQHIRDVPFLQGSRIIINGFHRFTPLEQSIVKELFHVANKVQIALILPGEERDKPLDELDLFYQTKETYQSLCQQVEDEGIVLEKPVILSASGKKESFLNHLQEHFDTRPTPSFTGEVEGSLVLAEAVHPRAEIEGVIQEILRLVREEGYRYRDFAIFLRETETYYDLLQTLFHDYGIPIFIDEKRTMLNHPLIEAIRSLFDILESNWRYDAIFRFLKTNFIEPTDAEYPLTLDAIDQLENYVLQYGIRYKQHWTQEKDWIYERFRGFQERAQTDAEVEMERKINRYRQQVVSLLQPFDEAFRQATSVRERTEQLYLFLEKLNIPRQLEAKRRELESEGLLERAREEEQVWKAIVGLFDELVEMIGEERLSLADYRAIVEAGLEALEFSHVPPSMDHVIVGTIDHSRIQKKKCVFLLGVNEGVWPMAPKADSMINEKEREFLEHFGLQLAASNRRVLLDDYFYMYNAFTLPTDYLWVSYVLSGHEGEAKIPSQMVFRLEELFPAMKDQRRLLTDPEELQEAEWFITTPSQTRGPLTVQLARYLRGYPIEEIWWEVVDWYIRNEPKDGPSYRALQSLFYRNRPRDLNKETVERLVPRKVKASVSRVEMLYRCSYQHFLHYTLSLKERRTYTLEAPDIGELFHEALKVITERLQEEGRDFKDVTKEEASEYAKGSLADLSNVLEHHVLMSSNRYRYITKKLEQVIAQATYILSEQARASGFSPVGIELAFGYRSGLDPVRIPLPNGRELLLRGRIDRVDKGKRDEHLYLRIIDYKSSKQSLELEDVYYGLALQILTYLHVVLLQAETWLGSKASPAGVLYFHVHDAMVNNDENLSDDKLAQELMKQYRMQGLILKDPEIAVLMDEDITSRRSPIIPANLKKDGDFDAYSKVQDEATFMTLRSYVHQLLRQAGIYMTSGQVELNPFETKKGNACRFCSYRSICQFDPVLEENDFRRLPPLKDKEAIERMQETLEVRKKE